MDFTGKKILVTGSTMGIGRASAEMFLEAGATVAINGRKASAVEQAMRELGGKRLVAAPGDVSTVPGCRSIVAAAVGGLGGLDVLVNNAGVGTLSYPMDVTEEHWDQVMAVNLRATMFCTHAALPALRQSKGNVVMVASAAGLTAGPTDSFVYAISKGALIHMTRTLALELVADGIRINAICPGYIDTPMIQAENAATGGQIYDFIKRSVPMGRIGTLRECASGILYLASDEAGYSTGSVLVNDGGCTANASWGGANLGPPPSGPATQFIPNSVTR
jgi:NAD(P)-dependent dehydrogenase (short-subunit alcohol dehydrogenase family)